MIYRTGSPKRDAVYLDWPDELAGGDRHIVRWAQPLSNICLDFHGDPANAQLVVFSDGNHHMALRECLDLFSQQNSGLSDIFYATTPPGPLVKMLKKGALQIGNLVISASPHVFISPPEVLDSLVEDGFMSEHIPFVRNQGNVLLVKKDNPKRIFTVSDLMRGDVRLFLSNPETEKASFTAYYNTLKAVMSAQTGDADFPDNKMAQGQVVFGKRIHHREAPQAVADGSADVAVLFYHLALRYLRIFPDLFDVIPLGGSLKKPEPLPGNIVCRTHMGLIDGGGAWGASLIHFLSTRVAGKVYARHGLIPIKKIGTT